jgi:hypothetical protein
MKKLMLTIVLMLIASMGFGQITMTTKDNTTATPTEVIKTFDPAETPIAAILRAIAGIGTVEASGTLVTVGSPPTRNITETVAVTDTAQDITSLADRKSVTVWNTDDTLVLWVSLDSGTASATVDASVPVWPYSMISLELDSDLVVGLVASEALSAVVYQDGY